MIGLWTLDFTKNLSNGALLGARGRTLPTGGVDGLGDTVGAYEQNKVWVFSVVTHSFWFSQFMSDLHKRVGEVRKQDKPVPIEVLREVGKILEGEWRQGSDAVVKC